MAVINSSCVGGRLSLAAMLVALAGCSQIDPQRSSCVAGLWQTQDGVAAAANVREDNTLRITAFDGRAWTLAPEERRWRGSLGQKSGTGDTIVDDRACGEGRLTMTFRGTTLTWVRTPLNEHRVSFRSAGAVLNGKLVLPGGVEPKSLVVLLHGSEKRSAIASNPLQYLLPSQGVAVFAFDKRGTGNSEGSYTQNFDVLARDAVAALATARKSLNKPGVPVGLQGGSQGAWIATLAASRAPAAKPDFVVAAYGLAQRPLDEDREEVFDDLRRRGFDDPAVLAKAREITDATAAVMVSGFNAGFERLEALKEKYQGEPWYSVIEGEFTGDFLSMPGWLLQLVGPVIDDDTTWNYDPLPDITKLSMPMLWVLAGKDSEAPSATTLAILQQLQQQGHATIDIALFPEAEHAMVTFTERNFERTPTGIVPGYFTVLAGWCNDRQLRNAPGAVTWLGRPTQGTAP
ncbi:MAG: alpha/beta fold hydrolase [Alphaproteobacteria bacterium]|nr:alpha/beta fold hydrolase [Alphaproteobacteria bacterium]